MWPAYAKLLCRAWTLRRRHTTADQQLRQVVTVLTVIPVISAAGNHALRRRLR